MRLSYDDRGIHVVVVLFCFVFRPRLSIILVSTGLPSMIKSPSLSLNVFLFCILLLFVCFVSLVLISSSLFSSSFSD